MHNRNLATYLRIARQNLQIAETALRKGTNTIPTHIPARVETDPIRHTLTQHKITLQSDMLEAQRKTNLAIVIIERLERENV